MDWNGIEGADHACRKLLARLCLVREELQNELKGRPCPPQAIWNTADYQCHNMPKDAACAFMLRE